MNYSEIEDDFIDDSLPRNPPKFICNSQYLEPPKPEVPDVSLLDDLPRHELQQGNHLSTDNTTKKSYWLWKKENDEKLQYRNDCVKNDGITKATEEKDCKFNMKVHSNDIVEQPKQSQNDSNNNSNQRQLSGKNYIVAAAATSSATTTTNFMVPLENHGYLHNKLVFHSSSSYPETASTAAGNKNVDPISKINDDNLLDFKNELQSLKNFFCTKFDELTNMILENRKIIKNDIQTLRERIDEIAKYCENNPDNLNINDCTDDSVKIDFKIRRKKPHLSSEDDDLSCILPEVNYKDLSDNEKYETIQGKTSQDEFNQQKSTTNIKSTALETYENVDESSDNDEDVPLQRNSQNIVRDLTQQTDRTLIMQNLAHKYLPKDALDKYFSSPSSLKINHKKSSQAISDENCSCTDNYKSVKNQRHKQNFTKLSIQPHDRENGTSNTNKVVTNQIIDRNDNPNNEYNAIDVLNVPEIRSQFKLPNKNQYK